MTKREKKIWKSAAICKGEKVAQKQPDSSRMESENPNAGHARGGKEPQKSENFDYEGKGGTKGSLAGVKKRLTKGLREFLSRGAPGGLKKGLKKTIRTRTKKEKRGLLLKREVEKIKPGQKRKKRGNGTAHGQTT